MPKSKPQDTHDAADIEQALTAAEASVREIRSEVDSAASPLDAGDLSDLDEDRPPPSAIDLLGDVDLEVSVELGRTQMLVEDVLRLQNGSVVELEKLAGDPVDVLVNGRLVARGEVLVLDDKFCIRISEIVANLEEETEFAREAALA